MKRISCRFFFAFEIFEKFLSRGRAKFCGKTSDTIRDGSAWSNGYWNRTWNPTLYLLNEVISHAQSFLSYIFSAIRKGHRHTYVHIKILLAGVFFPLLKKHMNLIYLSFSLFRFQPVRYGNYHSNHNLLQINWIDFV